ncbi:hypothetical protein [Roseibium marinum]|uniref:Uncharacterized protein n=1 Tax=Roseibium marinum TaxID=281252 RepID=A0A2S3UK83_9HYPH|nr:hypothetical protein [Roseibium marinum]POF28128.1 hypothetical protein CLV41_11762 [Roseibium marinum]
MGNWEIKLDGNKAIDQMTALAEKLWKEISKPATAVVVELLNESNYDLRHRGNFVWQGFFKEPSQAEIPHGYGAVWGMESTGIDGSFGAAIYQLWEGDKELHVYLVIGNLVYWDGAQPLFTAELTTTDQYGEGKPRTLTLLNEGKSASWTENYADIGGVKMNLKVDIWTESAAEKTKNFRIQMTPNP